MPNFTKLIGKFLIAATLIGSTAEAADIQHRYIRTAGDDLAPAVLGNVLDAITIGQQIAGAKWDTVVESTCASACGLIWLAGKHRFVTENASVGFHAVYYTDTGQMTPNGNAIVGAYLSKLGFSIHTISYLTSMPPDQMDWLNSAKAKEYDIAVRVLTAMPPLPPTVSR